MVKIKDECCDCATESYPCLGSECPRKRVAHMYCDKCNYETDELYEFDGKQLCSDCVLKSLEKVKVEDL